MECCYPQSAQEDGELLQLKQDELEQQINNTKEAEERFHRDSQLMRDRSVYTNLL